MNVRGSSNTTRNLRGHYKTKHKGDVEALETVLNAESKKGKKRVREEEEPVAGPSGIKIKREDSEVAVSQRPRQIQMEESFSRSRPTKEQVDRALAMFIVTDMLPLRVVETPGFKYFMKCVRPEYTIPTRKTIGKRIITAYMEGKEELIKILAEQEWVATTADCWSSRHRSFLGK